MKMSSILILVLFNSFGGQGTVKDIVKTLLVNQ